MNALNIKGRSHDWTTSDICAAVIEDAAEMPVEGHSFLVLTDDDETAREVAPLMAQRLYPDRRFGAVLHSEPVPGEGIEVVLRVL